MDLVIANRQRRVKLDLAGQRELLNRLLTGVFASLRIRPCPDLSPELLADLEQRGILSLVLVSNNKIREINKQYRARDRATDVISFPLSLDPPPQGMPWEFGEIFISVEKAAEQAEEYAHSLKRELAFLFVHGTLHVLGFDHQSADEEKEMFSRQKEILEGCGVTS